MVYEADNEAEKNALDICHANDQDMALLVTPTNCDPKIITVAWQVVFKAMYERPILVFTQAASLIEVIRHGNVAKGSCVHDG